MKKLFTIVTLAFAMLLQCTFSTALVAEGNAEGILPDIKYSSVAQVRDKLFFWGEGLYSFDAANGSMIEERRESIQSLYEKSKIGDLVLVNGGSELHALDTSTGSLYKLGEDEGCLAGQFNHEIFDAETDPMELRRFLTPTIVSTMDSEALYLLVTNQDQPTKFDLLYFELPGGASGAVNADNAISFTEYKDGKIVAILEQPDLYRIVEIDISTQRVGSVLYEEKNPHYRMTGMAYDQNADKLIVVTGKGIYQIADQAMIDLYAYLPYIEERIISMDFNCFLNGKYVFVNQNVFFTSDLNAAGASKSLRFANNGLGDQNIMGFMKQNPEVKISFTPGMVWDNKIIAESLLGQSSDVDIITLYAGAGLSTIRRKGYFADLSSSMELAQDISLMYPQIREVLTEDEKIIAYPRDMTAYCWLVDDNALRQMGYAMDTSSMGEWLTFVEEFAADFDADESASSLFPQGFTRGQLVQEILIQYIVEHESLNQLDFTDPTLEDILKRILKLPQSIFLEGAAESSSIDAYDLGLSPLFTIFTTLSPDTTIGFYEGYEPSFTAPPVFSTQNAPAVRATMSVYLVNPYSKNKETAIEFLEYCARHKNPTQRFYLEQAFDQPVPSPEFVEFKERTLGMLEELTNRLELAPEENQAHIKAQIESQTIILEYARKNEWLVSDADIAAYQQMSPGFTFVPFSLCFTDSTYSVTNIDLYEMIDRLLTKNVDLEGLLAEAQRKYTMIRRETN